MAQWVTPAATKFLNCACNKTGSGVVMPVDINAGGSPTPKVPTTAQRAVLLRAFKACANHQVVEVLPLVPVTAMTFKSWLGCS